MQYGNIAIYYDLQVFVAVNNCMCHLLYTQQCISVCHYEHKRTVPQYDVYKMAGMNQPRYNLWVCCHRRATMLTQAF